MKNKHTLLVVLMLLLVGQASAQKITSLRLTGKVNSLKEGKIYIQRYDNKLFKTIDSTLIKNGRFSFTTKVELPELYALKLFFVPMPVLQEVASTRQVMCVCFSCFYLFIYKLFYYLLTPD